MALLTGLVVGGLLGFGTCALLVSGSEHHTPSPAPGPHKVTLLPVEDRWRATCSCGWRSPSCDSETAAVAHWLDHAAVQ